MKVLQQTKNRIEASNKKNFKSMQKDMGVKPGKSIVNIDGEKVSDTLYLGGHSWAEKEGDSIILHNESPLYQSKQPTVLTLKQVKLLKKLL